MKKNILITGGTSGIGFNAAKTLVKNPENNLILIGKNINKGELALRKLREISKNKNISFLNWITGSCASRHEPPHISGSKCDRVRNCAVISYSVSSTIVKVFMP